MSELELLFNRLFKISLTLRTIGERASRYCDFFDDRWLVPIHIVQFEEQKLEEIEDEYYTHINKLHEEATVICEKICLYNIRINCSRIGTLTVDTTEPLPFRE